MNDLELYIYIALAVIYFLSRAFRKKKQANPPAQRPRSSGHKEKVQAAPSKKPLTFEDLLREFTGQKKEHFPEDQSEMAEIEEEEVVELDYDQEDVQIVEEYESDYSSEKNGGYKSYEEVYGTEQNIKTLNEQVKLSEPSRKRFDTYKIEESKNIYVAERFRELLKNKDTLKDAIILKEILDRKYF